MVFDFFRCEQIFGPQPVEAKAQLYYDNSVMARIMYEVGNIHMPLESSLGCKKYIHTTPHPTPLPRRPVLSMHYLIGNVFLFLRNKTNYEERNF